MSQQLSQRCPRCGEPAAPDDLFCKRCGYPLRVRCPACRQETSIWAVFCPQCAYPLRGQPSGPFSRSREVVAVPFAQATESLARPPGLTSAPAAPQSGTLTVPTAPAGPQTAAPIVPGASAGPQTGAPTVPTAPGGAHGGPPASLGPAPVRAISKAAGQSLARKLVGTLTGKIITAVLVTAVVAASATLIIRAKVPSPSASGQTSATPTPTPKPVGIITEFPLQTSTNVLGGIAAGSDGNLWFTEGNGIERITPQGQITEFPVPTSESVIGGITAGRDGNFWFTAMVFPPGTFTPAIGYITPAGQLTTFQIDTFAVLQGNITAGPDGNLWFTEVDTSGISNPQVGRITVAGQFTSFSSPPNLNAPSRPAEDITAGPDGNLWFTESADFSGNGNVGRITPQGQITEFPLPTADSEAVGITAGPDKNLWFTEIMYDSSRSQVIASKIGRITPQGQVMEFPLPNSTSGPDNITAGPDGNLWFTECTITQLFPHVCNGGGKIGRITPQGQITEFLLPNPNNTLGGITAGRDGNLWFTECTYNSSNGQCTDGKIGRITSGK